MRTQRLVREFMELVQVPGLPLQEGLIARIVGRKLDDLGVSYTMDRAGSGRGAQVGNLIARLPGNVQDAIPIAFAAHLDVVAPVDGMVPELRDGVVYSDGAHILGADNRSAVALLLELARVLREERRPHGPIELLFTIDEEGGMTGARELDLAALQARLIFTPDSDNPANLERFGTHYAYVRLDFHGKAAHAQTPDEGIHAIRMAAAALAALDHGLVAPGTTLNLGQIRGGRAENIIPDHVVVHGELRGLDPVLMAVQVQRLREVCREAAAQLGGRAEVQVTPDLPGYVLDRQAPIVKLVKQAMEQAGLIPIEVPTGATAESGVFNARGIPAISLGTGAYNVHGHDEFTPVDDLVRALRLFEALVSLAAG